MTPERRARNAAAVAEIVANWPALTDEQCEAAARLLADTPTAVHPICAASPRREPRRAA